MVRKRASSWHYDFMINRVRYRGAIPEARNKAQAKKAEAVIRLSVYEGRYGRKADTTLFSDFVDQVYLPWAKATKRTWDHDEDHCNVLCQFFGKKVLGQISPLSIERFKKERSESKTQYKRQRRPASVNRELATLSRIFSLARDNGLINDNPCSKVRKLREDNERKRYLTLEEQQKLMEALTGNREYIRPIVIAAIHTGMRRGELFNLRWANVDFSRNIIRVTRTKTNKDRDVPMNSQVRELLLNLQKDSKSEYVFASPKSGNSLRDVKKGFKAALKDAGITDFRFHDLRHTAGTRLADVGTDAFAIAEILGHSSLQMTKRYTHATDERKRKALEALAMYDDVNCHKIVTIPKKARG